MKYSNIRRSAEISECGRYRWWLRRSWNAPQIPLESRSQASKGTCCFVMLNPSTADGTQDDPTIRRCIAFADSWGYTSLSVRNLFPWRATDPSELSTAEAVTGGERGDAELLAACTGDMLVAAWGAGVPSGRDKEVRELWATRFPSVPIYCLGKTKHGHPRHPLYVRGDAVPMLLSEGEA